MRVLLLSVLAMAVFGATTYNLTKNEFSVDIHYVNDDDVNFGLYFQNMPDYSDNMYMALGFGSTVLRSADVYICQRTNGGGNDISDHIGDGNYFGKYLDVPEDTNDNVANPEMNNDYDEKKGWYCSFTRPRIATNKVEDMSFGKGQTYSMIWAFGEIDEDGNLLLPNEGDNPGKMGTEDITIKLAGAWSLQVTALVACIFSVFAF